MKNLTLTLSVVCATIFFSCKKVISVNLNSASPQIVIAGEVTNAPGPYQVSVNTTVNFSSDNSFPPVSGAVVILSDNLGLNDSLTETSPGIYSSHTFWLGIPGYTYTLRVTAQSKSYTAVSTMPQPVQLDSIGFQLDSRGRNRQVIEAIPYYQDPGGIANYYQFTETINNIVLNKIILFDDRYSDGKYISVPLFDDSSHMKVGDQLTLAMFSIDKNVFQYFSELQQLLEANPFNEATPSNPDTNITGGALGYFSAHTVQTKQATVHL
ncbi:MAG TPA: DUF4249 domain-containing protein [Puia sp.]|jgi:hypothetical protein|nr:DUF4249 domain-containing protein [Puia sp.]